MYKNLWTICKIVFNHDMEEEQITGMNNIVKGLIRNIVEIEPSFNIFPKLHHLLHYEDLSKIWGPLMSYATFKYERKHQTFKIWSRMMYNHVNPTLTLSQRHQRLMAMNFEKNSFVKINFELPSVVDESSLRPASFINQDFEKVQSFDLPHKLRKHVLKEIRGSRIKKWFEPTSYWKKASGELFAQGYVWKIAQVARARDIDRMHENVSTLRKLVKDSNGSLMVISDQFLHHVKDFLFTNESDENFLVFGLL